MNFFQFFITCNRPNNANNATYYVKIEKKRRKSSKRNYYIISPRVIIKAIIISSAATDRGLLRREFPGFARVNECAAAPLRAHSSPCIYEIPTARTAASGLCCCQPQPEATVWLWKMITFVTWSSSRTDHVTNVIIFFNETAASGSCISVDRISLLQKYLERDPQIVRSRQAKCWKLVECFSS